MITHAPDAAKALFGDKSEIKELYYHYNGVVEDGATEWNIIIGQKADGSFVALSYSNFPF